MRDRNGNLRIGRVLALVVALAWVVSAFAVDSYQATGVGQLMISTVNGALCAPVVGLIPRPADPSNAQLGNIWGTVDRNALRTLPPGWTAAQGFANVLTTNVTLSDAVANPTSNTSFTLVFSVPADALTAGKHLRLHASGFYTTGAATAGNLSFTGEMGPSGQALATTGNVSTTSAASSLAWVVEEDVIVYTSGASGTLFSTIRATVENTGSGAVTESLGMGRLTRAVNTTVANTIALETKISVSDAACVVKCEEFTVEQLN